MVAKLGRKLKPSIPLERGHRSDVSVRTHTKTPFQINDLHPESGRLAIYKEFERSPRFGSG